MVRARAIAHSVERVCPVVVASHAALRVVVRESLVVLSTVPDTWNAVNESREVFA